MATALLENAIVTIFRYELSTDSYTNVKSTTTNALGEYSVSGLQQGRSYKIKFQDADGNYLTVYRSQSGDQFDLETGNPIPLAGDWVNVDVTLTSGGSISGVIEGEV